MLRGIALQEQTSSQVTPLHVHGLKRPATHRRDRRHSRARRRDNTKHAWPVRRHGLGLPRAGDRAARRPLKVQRVGCPNEHVLRRRLRLQDHVLQPTTKLYLIIGFLSSYIIWVLGIKPPRV